MAKRWSFSVFFLGIVLCSSWAAAWEANVDESKVLPYTLPDVLTMSDGTPVTTAEDWINKRRPELLELFQSQMYGRMPSVDRSTFRFEELTRDENALSGKATRLEMRIIFTLPTEKDYSDQPAETHCDLLIYIPNRAEKPIPAFLGANFQGNHTVNADLGITISDNQEGGRIKGTNREERRGAASSRWPIEMIIDRGYALATVYYEELIPDAADLANHGIHPLFTAEEKNLPEGERASTITGWAWGLSRCLDCLETIPEIDAKRVAVMGHSRLGKTALWAGANDTRFAMAISNDSGCGGAALTRRNFGETIEFMDQVIFYWFCKNYHQYANDTSKIPFDQHCLIALMAPRPVCVASAEEDTWADPKGEFLSAYYADPVYRLLGEEGIGENVPEALPAVENPVGKKIHYHIRRGDHDVTDYDWEQYLQMADRYLK